MATNCFSLNLAQKDTQQVSPFLMCTDRLHLWKRDLSEVRCVAENVATGAVEFGVRVVCPTSTASFFISRNVVNVSG